jgi:hypothetical protein
MGSLPPTRRRRHQGTATAWLPWVWRAAETLLADGPEAIALGERDTDEVLAIWRVAVELICERPPRRPCARRRRAA